jgi:hypothetical protein
MEGRDHSSRSTLSSMNIKYPHPILAQCVINKSRQEDIRISDSGEHNQTRTLTKTMREVMELVESYNQTLETDTKRIQEFEKFLESYRLGEEGSPERTDGEAHYVQQLRRSVSAIRTLVSPARWAGTRSSDKNKIRDMSAQIQCCKNQLTLLNSEVAKQIVDLIRERHKCLELMRIHKANPGEWPFVRVEHGFCLNTRFVRSLETLLEALGSCRKLKVESDKYWGDSTFPSKCAHPFTKEHVIQYGEELLNFSERFIKLAQEIQIIAYETGSQNVEMVNPRSSTPPSAFA